MKDKSLLNEFIRAVIQHDLGRSITNERYEPDIDKEGKVWVTIIAKLTSFDNDLSLISADRNEMFLFLAAAIAVSGNESSFGKGATYLRGKNRTPLHANPAQKVLSDIGFDVSVGPTQTRMSNIAGPEFDEVKRRLGVSNASDLDDIAKAVIITAKYLKKNYDIAKSLGYSTDQPGINENNPQINWKSTGNAALDLALCSYNGNPALVLRKWCGSKGNVKPCADMPTGTPQYKNYIPRYMPEDAPDESWGTLGYINNVAVRLDRILIDLDYIFGQVKTSAT